MLPRRIDWPLIFGVTLFVFVFLPRVVVGCCSGWFKQGDGIWMEVAVSYIFLMVRIKWKIQTENLNE
jgi:hypothetical protein